MAKKVNKENELLLPSLALSALALTLVGVLVTAMGSNQPGKTTTSVSASGTELTRGTEIEDLQADLEILEEDSLETELGIVSGQ